MSAARDDVLARVRAALPDAGAPGFVPRRYRRTGARGRAEVLALLAERLADYRAEVQRVAEAELGTILPSGRVAVPSGLPAAWRPAGAVEDRELTPFELDVLDGVVTGCTVAIAETGTLVLTAGPEEGRRALTLVPDLHVCIVRGGQVVETVPEAFDRLARLRQRPLTFVSGPSATSDIELSRVEGVHGPRRLVVAIVDDEGRSGAAPPCARSG